MMNNFNELSKALDSLNKILDDFQRKFEPLKTNLTEEEKTKIGRLVGELMLASYEIGKNDKDDEEWETRFYARH